jgi:EAL domain-containing protein (putative c-di-GMP-specific phosphodiesterase class I)
MSGLSHLSGHDGGLGPQRPPWGSAARTRVAIVEAALTSAHAIELDTSAAGVEDERQLRWLAARGCSYVQGFLLGPACTADDFERNDFS